MDPKSQSLQVILPSKPHQIIGPLSAGSLQHKLLGLNSRIVAIVRQTFPKSLVPDSLLELNNKYQEAGFTPIQLAPYFNKAFARYR